MKVIKAWKSNLKNLTTKEYELLRDMCHMSKSVYNATLYNIRQHYFETGEFLSYESNYYKMKDLDIYKYLGAAVAQQTMRDVDHAFKSFFALLKKSKQGSYSARISMPTYLPEDGSFKLSFCNPSSQQKHIASGFYNIPLSSGLSNQYDKRLKIKVPIYCRDKKIKQIWVVPRCNSKYFEAVFIFEEEVKNNYELDFSKALAIDLGVDNFATCATSDGDAFIIDGRKIKSQNQWYNKQLSRLSSIKDKQKIKSFTKLQYKVTQKRNRQIQNFIYCSTKHVINYCIQHQIGNIAIGYNDGFQDSPDFSSNTNQIFVSLPYGKFKDRLEYLCKLNNISIIRQEESYTSKASFFDNDKMPVWNADNPSQGDFSGKRIYRGLYKRANGQVLNADVNGALNILRKSKLNSMITHREQCSGAVITPLRIRLS